MTNLYAERFIAKNKGNLSSRLKKWKKVTTSEMKLFLGFILYQGMLWKPTYEQYFTTNSIFSTPGVKNFMSYNRFQIIDCFLHFVDNEELGEKHPLAAKIQPVWDYCSEKFRSIYTPRKYISIDESLLLWKGRLSWKQSILTKRARFGFKMYSVNESESGYIYKSLLYTGKEMTEKLAGDYKYVATKIVMDLMHDLLDIGHTLFIDNWYWSFELSKLLLSHSTDTVGTIRADRKDLPAEVKKKKGKKMKKGEGIVLYERGTNVIVTQWRDKKDVSMMSTCVNDGTVTVKRAGKDKEIPCVADFYNQHMGGVDKSDQMLTSYEIERKRVKKWYKKVFHHLVNQSVFNAHIVHMRLVDSDKLTALKFREKLVTDIVVKYATPTTSSRHGRGGSENNELRLIG